MGHIAGRGPHALLRMFANEPKAVSLRDLAGMGGWKRPQTVPEVYHKPDIELRHEALTQRRPRQTSWTG